MGGARINQTLRGSRLVVSETDEQTAAHQRLITQQSSLIAVLSARYRPPALTFSSLDASPVVFLGFVSSLLWLESSVG